MALFFSLTGKIQLRHGLKKKQLENEPKVEVRLISRLFSKII